MHRSNIMLSMEDLPVWRWSALVTEDSFVKIPPNFTWPDEEDEPEEEIKALKIPFTAYIKTSLSEYRNKYRNFSCPLPASCEL
jgi:hypothetical protein